MKENFSNEIFLFFSMFFILKFQISLKLSYIPVCTMFRKYKINLVVFLTLDFSHVSSDYLPPVGIE